MGGLRSYCVWVTVVILCHWGFRGILIASVFNLDVNTDTAGMFYFYEIICFYVILNHI